MVIASVSAFMSKLSLLKNNKILLSLQPFKKLISKIKSSATSKDKFLDLENYLPRQSNAHKKYSSNTNQTFKFCSLQLSKFLLKSFLLRKKLLINLWWRQEDKVIFQNICKV